MKPQTLAAHSSEQLQRIATDEKRQEHKTINVNIQFQSLQNVVWLATVCQVTRHAKPNGGANT